MAYYQLLLLTIVLLEGKCHVLKQIFVLSRHNVRAPLSHNLESTTPNKWPDFLTPASHLTSKGAMLESYMGDAFAKMLKIEKLLQEPCPKEDSVYIYANAYQRTKETAKAFVNAAFKNCNISVHYTINVVTDPVFNPIIRNTSNEFKKAAIEDMQRKLGAVNLTEAYTLLDEITDFKNSQMCKDTKICDLVNDKNEIVFEVGAEPDIRGPLSVGNSLVDVFLMSLYEGLPLKDIGWGKITELHQWKLLSEITLQNQNVRFNITSVAKDVARPLLEFMTNTLLNENAPNVTILFGHDSNLNSVITSLNIKHFELPNQFERTPIGGKLVFQKFYDEMFDRDLLKINYVYQSTQQLRSGIPLSDDYQAQYVVLYLNDCEIVDLEYCLWDDFTTILKNLY